MNKSVKTLFTVMIIVIGLLAVTSGFFIAKTVSLEKNANNSVAPVVSPTNAPTDSVDLSGLAASPSVSASVSPAPSVSASAIPKVSVSPKASVLPKVTATPTPTSVATGTKYVVKSGDTMSTIAAQYKVSWLNLAKANGLDATTANNIKIGQILTIPSK